MVVLNYTGEEINAKIVYYGPGLSGKTTNLEYLYGQMPADSKGQMVSMKTRTDRTLFFDFFPLELGEINGYRTRFLLYTVPGQVYYNATRKLVLKGADAVVFVADSAPDKLQENIESLRNLEDNLNEHGLSLDDIPWVIQYNKRDLQETMPVAELHQHLNLMNVPAYEAIAMTGFGVYDTFKGIAGILYRQLKERLESGDAIPTATSDGATVGGSSAAPVPARNVDDAVDSVLRELGPSAPAAQPVRPTAPAAPAAKPAGRPDPPPAGPAPWDPQGTPRPQPQPVRTEQRPTPPTASTAAERSPQPPPAAADRRSEEDPDSFHWGGDGETSPDVGRMLELDETPDESETINEEPPEFITDPMRTGGKKPAVDAADIEADRDPVVVERKAEAGAQEIVVPVVISRSQVKKTIPLKLRLDIRVVDD